jgi:peptidoglycan/xylan/chitin deacetylase (PgdA/CDA1 family)
MVTTAQTGGIKRLLFFLLRMSSVPYLIRESLQRRRVTILVYHKPSAELVDMHLAVLRRRFNCISLAEYIEFRSQKGKQLPAKSLIVTFDDGHRTNRALMPVLEKHGVRATIFLCSGLIGTNRHFWFETEMDTRLRQRLKRINDSERLDYLTNLGFSEEKEYPDRHALSVREIEEMRSCVDFQSHSVLHPILPQCLPVRALLEIARSKSDLEGDLGLSINAFAYPNGDYSEREISAVEKSGYQCAVTLDLGFNSRSTPPFQLKRICINDDAGVDELLVKASGLWGILRKVAQIGSKWGFPACIPPADVGKSQHPGVLE